ncbi:hypothetical protein EON62_02330, partial [archaeon]
MQCARRRAGEISASWSIPTASTPFGSKFLFDPPSGYLGVGESVPISVYFTSDMLGTFSEVFELTMQGCSAILRVHFKGHVIPPSFAVDATLLDFDRVPFDFTQTRSFTFTNTST